LPLDFFVGVLAVAAVVFFAGLLATLMLDFFAGVRTPLVAVVFAIHFLLVGRVSGDLRSSHVSVTSV
jgi:hypothetical protein